MASLMPSPPLRSAPHLRGWSSVLRVPAAPCVVGPAPAGMVRCRNLKKASTSSRPRTCGDGPSAGAIGARAGGSAPHLRGWSTCGASSPAAAGVGPAPAGMVRVACSRSGSATSRPRTCGDGPFGIGDQDGDMRSAPHLRGWSPHHRPRLRARRVGPAPAGMVRWPPPSTTTSGRRPRTCGDGPNSRKAAPAAPKSAPHLRGRPDHEDCGADRTGVGPAPTWVVGVYRAEAAPVRGV